MRYETRQRWLMRGRARRALRRWGSDLDEVERYAMFLGYPRSGHSLVGALLTAHPEMAVAHELDVLRWFEAGFTRDQLLALCLWRDRWFARRGHRWTGYSYHVDGADQGRWDRLRVVGDKKGGRSTERLEARPELIARLQDEMGLPFRVIHVVRNPFDNIATMHTKGGDPLAASADRYFRLADTNVGATSALDREEVFVLHQEALIARPQEMLARLTDFLGLTADAAYLDRCAEIVFPNPRRRRFTVDWPPGLVEDVQGRIDARPHLFGYSFEATDWPQAQMTAV